MHKNILILLTLFCTLAYGQSKPTAKSEGKKHISRILSEGKCSGDAYCTACTTCNYCKNCNSGGTCGVCTSYET